VTVLETWTLLATIALRGTLHHVQGIDVEGSALWVSSVDGKAGKGYLTRFELPSGNLLAQVEVQRGRRVHPGGIALDGDSIWLPLAEYDRDGPTTMERRDKATLQLRGGFEVADHIGCVAVAGAELVGGNWDSRIIYRWSRDGRMLGRIDNPRPNAYQDLKFIDGMLVGSGKLSRTEGAIDWLKLPGLELSRRVTAGTTDRGVLFTNEGMTIRGGRLYLLPEDDPSRLFVYRMQ
jgi:hypothetical protein